MNFLDKTGLSYFWSKIKDYISNQLSNIKVNIEDLDEATTSAKGLMSASDKTTLNNLPLVIDGSKVVKPSNTNYALLLEENDLK